MRGVMAGLLLLAAALTGCGGGTADEVVVLRVLMADDWATRPPILGAVRTFEADNPQVRIDMVGRPFGQIMDEIETAAVVGEPHDVVQEHAFSAGARGVAEPIDDWWAGQDDDDWFPGGIADVTWGDTRYGVPLDINALFLIANRDLIDDVPTTFPQVDALAAELRSEGAKAMPVPVSNWWVYGWIRANGGEIVEIADDGTPTFTLDRSENVEALQFIADLVLRGDAFGPTPEAGGANALSRFTTGQSAMMFSGTWDTTLLAAEHPDIPLVTAPMPGGMTGDTAGSVLGGSSLFVGKGTRHRELALAFIEALTADEVAVGMAALDGRLPPKPALFPAAGLTDPVYDGVIAQLQTAHPQRLIAFPAAQTAYEVAVDEAITGRVGAAEALRTAQRTAEGSLTVDLAPDEPASASGTS